jgi:hypothetical protein
MGRFHQEQGTSDGFGLSVPFVSAAHGLCRCAQRVYTDCIKTKSCPNSVIVSENYPIVFSIRNYRFDYFPFRREKVPGKFPFAVGKSAGKIPVKAK